MTVQILVGDALSVLRDMPDGSVHCCVTSPPYWGLRAYRGDPGMIGLEPTFDEHLANLVAVFRELRRVLRPDGTLWLNYGDAYAAGSQRTPTPKERPELVGCTSWAHRDASSSATAKGAGLKPKDLMMLPARVALALQADGWWLRSEIIWHKPNPMPESCRDRPTSSHEKMFLLSRSARYFYDAEAVRVSSSPLKKWPNGPGGKRMYEGEDSYERDGIPTMANLRNVWTIATHGFSEAHFATFPPALVEPCIRAGTSERGVCGECCAPWVREVESEDPKGRLGRGYHEHDDDLGRGQRGVPAASGAPVRKTTGWSPSCECGAAAVPATVLDPFAGSGTVGLVAGDSGSGCLEVVGSE